MPELCQAHSNRSTRIKNGDYYYLWRLRLGDKVIQKISPKLPEEKTAWPSCGEPDPVFSCLLSLEEQTIVAFQSLMDSIENQQPVSEIAINIYNLACSLLFSGLKQVQPVLELALRLDNFVHHDYLALRLSKLKLDRVKSQIDTLQLIRSEYFDSPDKWSDYHYLADTLERILDTVYWSDLIVGLYEKEVPNV